MIKRVTERKGYLIQIPATSPSSEALLFLHGFPGNRHVKSLDLALWTSQILNEDIFLTHYRGLGENLGEFLFTYTIEETVQHIKWLIEIRKYERVHLVGHSWGGLVAVNCAVELPNAIGSLILLSPFCDTENRSHLYEWFVNGVCTDCEGVYKLQPSVVIENDFNRILNHHLPMDLAANIPETIKVGIIQATDDETTPTAITKKFASKLQRPPVYCELKQDHGFTQNRLDVVNKICTIFNQFRSSV